jgi:hypothetical protein
MALQPAATATTASDGAVIQARDVLTSLSMTDINDAITAASIRTDLDERTYKIVLTFNADINGSTDPIEIIQSDSSRVFLEDVLDALEDAGYRTAIAPKPASRQGGQDRVTLTVAWD